jgi:Flp pilus assembly protein TadD
MFCKNCGAKNEEGAKFCGSCGQSFSEPDIKATPKSTAQTSIPKRKSGITAGRVVWILIILGFIGYGAYSSQDQQAVTTNNAALGTYDSSDSATSTQQVIQQFQTAYSNATDDTTKLGILKNLAFVYGSDGDTKDALSTFQEALQYAPQGSSDYYLVSGEIAELQNNPAAASTDLNQANAIKPQDFQIENELGLFYLDMNSSWTTYDDNAKALKYLQASYNAEANDASAENLAIAYYFNNDYQQAISLLKPLNITDHPTAAIWIGRAYADENDSTDAMIYFQKGINAGAQVPQDVTDYMNSH